MSYSLAWGRTAKHSADLEQGLRNMPYGFLAKMCWCCKGRGEYEQRYIEGRFNGVCDTCNGGGLIYHSGNAAPVTVVNQVLNSVPDSIQVPNEGKSFGHSRPRQPARMR